MLGASERDAAGVGLDGVGITQGYLVLSLLGVRTHLHLMNAPVEHRADHQNGGYGAACLHGTP